MKLQNLTVIFIIILIPVILLVSLYISTGTKTIKYQSLYDTGLLTATHDAIYAFELNTTNDAYSDNAETKRNILKSSVNLFEKSLCNTCGISAYNTSQIEEYIPAIVFGMYDGFYMYAPSLNPKTNEYEHSLKNYVYYSEEFDDGTVIRYSLDNYIVVSGNVGDGGEYITKSGYLIFDEDIIATFDGNLNAEKYKEIEILDDDAKKYNIESKEFTQWFIYNCFQRAVQIKKNGEPANYLAPSSYNDPEDENSAFVQHKNEVIREKIETVLNSSITAYSKRLGNYNYKMPKLLEEDWQKIYSNISMITFFQGKNIGLTKYNGYCVLNSTNNNEYVNSNLIYFVDQNNTYHDIRCDKCNEASKLVGYKIGRFQKIKLEKAVDNNGNVILEDGKEQYILEKGSNGANDILTSEKYKYEDTSVNKNGEETLACYDCINGSLEASQTINEYIRDSNTNEKIKKVYYEALFRERYNTTKLR